MNTISPEQLANKLNDNPVEAGGALIAVGMILKMTFVIKLIAYGFITFGLIYLWKGLSPRFKDETTDQSVEA